MISIDLRNATWDDSTFCYEAKRAAHRANVEATYGPWDEDFQRRFHDGQWRPAGVTIIGVDGEDVGWFACAEHADHVEVDALYVVPEHQGRGVGSRVMDHIRAVAAAAGKPVRLWVMKKNPAVRFYARHGFVKVGEKTTHWHMEAGA